MRKNRIRALRTGEGISQTELAKILNVHQTAVSQWEKGRTNPDIETLRQLSGHFGVSIDYILDGSDRIGSGNAAGNAAEAMPEDVALDDIEFAFLSETRDLTKDQKQTVLDFVRYVVKKKQDGA